MSKQYPLGPVMLDVAGIELTDDEREILSHPQVGGVIFFARNFECVQQLQALIQQIRECRPHLLIAVDHEGGRVQRFRTEFTRVPAMFELAQQQPHLLAPCGRLMAQELMAVGIDFTFAPVLDRYNPASHVIGDRAFDEDPERIVVLAEQFIGGLNAEGMAAVGKHFPGHGGVEGDTHIQSAVDERPLAEIMASDLLPFAQLAPHLAGVMPAHVSFPQVCEQPVGYSQFWLQNILREQLKFNGVIFSDDLAMAAAQTAGEPLARGQAALAAGCDMVLLCNQPQDAIALIEGLEANANDQQSTKKQLLSQREEREANLLKLSAYKRRSQVGFNWDNLQRDTQYLKTRDALEQFLA